MRLRPAQEKKVSCVLAWGYPYKQFVLHHLRPLGVPRLAVFMFKYNLLAGFALTNSALSAQFILLIIQLESSYSIIPTVLYFVEFAIPKIRR